MIWIIMCFNGYYLYYNKLDDADTRYTQKWKYYSSCSRPYQESNEIFQNDNLKYNPDKTIMNDENFEINKKLQEDPILKEEGDELIVNNTQESVTRTEMIEQQCKYWITQTTEHEFKLNRKCI